MKIILALAAPIGLAALIATLPLSAAGQSRGGVTLELETPRAGGRIAVAVYRNADDFRRSRDPVRTFMLDRTGSVTQGELLGLAPGRYAIAAFQDLNGDGRLGTNPVGVPTEPFGFSNDARVRFGPPSFEAAAVTIGASPQTQRIVLRNPMSAILR